MNFCGLGVFVGAFGAHETDDPNGQGEDGRDDVTDPGVALAGFADFLSHGRRQHRGGDDQSGDEDDGNSHNAMIPSNRAGRALA